MFDCINGKLDVDHDDVVLIVVNVDEMLLRWRYLFVSNIVLVP